MAMTSGLSKETIEKFVKQYELNLIRSAFFRGDKAKEVIYWIENVGDPIVERILMTKYACMVDHLKKDE
jgi:hypothetical protein